MHAVRSVLTLAMAGVLLLAGPAVSGPAHADEFPQPVQVTSHRGHAYVSWEASEEPDVVGYRLRVQDYYSGQIFAERYVPAGAALSADIVDLPRWQLLAVIVVSVHEGLEASESLLGYSDGFRVLSTLSLVDDNPIVLHDDGHSSRTYTITRKIRLDEPMPVDVYLHPKELSFEGRPAEGDTEEPYYPAQIDEWTIKIPAGETTAWYPINYWGDDWKRFEYGHWVFGFENLADHRPAGFPPPYVQPGSGLVEIDVQGQHLTMYESDEYFWPEALMLAQQTVEAGKTARVRVRLNSPAARRTQISYRLKDRTARSGRDYLGK